MSRRKNVSEGSLIRCASKDQSDSQSFPYRILVIIKLFCYEKNFAFVNLLARQQPQKLYAMRKLPAE
ncbi:hypothetical protein QR98_0034590 [Sarcoptes scabiei]|uniref:Uncharacterized protein n=1 Tax=Sarcoptes scabiei TaxID=52283 RepID=A0A132A245_SARSC|nr:hypothetical protein QR98_0034590 [Sarcoptes scabiei]